MRYKYSLSTSILQYCKRNMTEIIFKINLLYYNRHVRRILLQYRLCQKEIEKNKEINRKVKNANTTTR